MPVQFLVQARLTQTGRLRGPCPNEIAADLYGDIEADTGRATAWYS